MIKRLNLINPNYPVGPQSDAYYLPYSTAMLWSYAKSQTDIGNKWELGHNIFRRLNIDDIYKMLADADVVGFSTYIWNRNYNYALAAKIKQYNPKCTIILGGPEPALEKPDIFEKIPFVDAIVRQEGEKIFANFLRSNTLDDILKIPGLVINKNGERIDTGTTSRINDLECIPSPYLTGLFDDILRDNPSMNWSAILETNRGCPYQCTFCDWGGLTYNKVKKFDLDRVFHEIEWMGKNRIEYMYITDANFGMFVERDEQIIDKIIEVQQNNNGYPKFLTQTWAKNQKNHVVKLVKKLYESNKNTNLMLSLQSMDETTLSNIKRKNLEINKAQEIFELCAKENVYVVTEMILGLPGETLDSWKSGIYKLLDINQHNGITFYIAQMLENAEMSLKQREEFDIKTAWLDLPLPGKYIGDEIPEFLEIVISTKDMPHLDFRKAIEFLLFINTWHISGIAQYHSRLLNKLHDVRYEDFYEGLETYIRNFDWINEEIKEFNHQLDLCLNNTPDRSSIAAKSIYYLPLMTRANTAIKNNLNLYHDAVSSYVSEKYGHLLNKNLQEDLNKFAKNYVVDYNYMDIFPFNDRFDHNIDGFINRGEDLFQPTIVKFDIYDKEVTLETFVYLLYLGRKRNFGKATLERIKDE